MTAQTSTRWRGLLGGPRTIVLTGLLVLAIIFGTEILTLVQEDGGLESSEVLSTAALGALLFLVLLVAYWQIPAALGAYIALLLFGFSSADQLFWLVTSLVVFTALAASLESALIRHLYLAFIAIWMLQFALRSERDAIILVVLAPVVALTYLAARSIFVLRKKNQQSISQMEALRQRTEEAIRNERKNIARDLHDIVAHDITIVAMQSKAAKFANDEQTSREAIEIISKLSSETLHDLRLMLNVLRTDGTMSDIGAADEMNPAATTIHALHGVQVFSQRLQDAGFEVETISAKEVSELPRSAHTALYRVMQEATTNIIKHAEPNSRCSISLRRVGEKAVLRMVNQLPQQRTKSTRDALWGGSGLIGMEDRMQAFGGHFQAGSQGTDWVLIADIPF